MDWKIPLFDLEIGREEEEAVLDVLKSGWFSLGERAQEFEDNFKEKSVARFAFSVTNGTAALHLACVSAGFKAGDEVICPALNFVAGANAIRYTGADVVFAESNEAALWEGKIWELLTNTGLRESIAQAGKRLVEEKYSAAVFNEKLCKHIFSSQG